MTETCSLVTEAAVPVGLQKSTGSKPLAVARNGVMVIAAGQCAASGEMIPVSPGVIPPTPRLRIEQLFAAMCEA